MGGSSPTAYDGNSYVYNDWKNATEIEDIETAKNFPTIISLLFIGKVNKVSNVPLSFSPAVVSVAG